MDKVLLINKEKDYTSRDVVNIISGIFKTKKVGHFGTLDPLATGLLVIGIGSLTKIGNLFNNDTKEYVAEVLIGKSTDTYDITGTVLKEEKKEISKEDLIKVLNSFKGAYNQEVPIYSSVKVNGKKLYEYARKGEKVNLPKKEVTIFNIKLLDIYEKDNNKYFSFSCLVSKGTYIRSLINDISKEINIPLCMSNLKRTKQDKFLIEDSYSLEDIKNNNYKLLAIEDVLDVTKIEIPKELETKIINGSLIENKYKKMVLFTKNNINYVLYNIYEKDNNYMKPVIFLNKE